MSEKEQLYELLNMLQSRQIGIKDFAKKFVKIFDLEIDYNELSKREYEMFGEISDISARFSDDPEDLKIPNVYYSEKQIRNEVMKTLNLLK
ncbi:hypothetical protein [Xylocopilactobacillus apicola]|uniref:Colicin D immunity protein domain-containing protein n=1 Tax=Xylocopilactobacillus apicola TaxID=2932184 RepID=A0AAU9DH24_9LACO|nr:hypothetical protein [Xylocopilactobacillus apicola]BDR59265.1 hypothetical protein XA3_17060 [Xylocopilactobacillus apicola]